MIGNSKELRILVTAHDTAKDVLNRAGKNLDSFDKKHKGIVGGLARHWQTYAVVAAAAIGTVAMVVAAGMKEYREHEKVMSEVTAGIQSTGGAAHVTAKEVEGLADSLQKKTGIDDEAILKSESLLLTFSDIRNEVGKDSKVFDQATLATLDLSQRMGKDIPGAAIMLGKALQDPIIGVTALKRAGVQLTDAQRDQIKVMVEAGDKLGAQKLILKEVERQVGGTAFAYRNTLSGSISAVKNSFNDFAESLVSKQMPGITSAANQISEAFDKLAKNGSLAEMINGVGYAVAWLIPKIAMVITNLSKLPQACKIIAADVKQVFYLMQGDVLNIINKIADIAEHVPGPLGKWGTEMKNETRLAAAETKRNIIELQLDKDVITGVWQAANKEVSQSIAQMGPAAVAKMGQNMTAIGMTIAQGKPAMAIAMAGNMNGVITALVDGAGVAGSKQKGLVSELTKTISSSNFYTATTEEMHKLAAGISQNTDIPISTVLAMMNTLRGSVNNTDLKGAITNAMAPIPGQILTFELPSFQSGLAVGGGVGRGMQGGMDSKAGDVQGAGANLHENARIGAGNLYPDGYNIGGGLGQGVRDGVNSMFSGVTTAVTNMIAAAKAAAKAAAGVGCPDPWPFTQELGGGFADGIATGINNQSHLAIAAARGLIGNLGGSTSPSLGLNVHAPSLLSGGLAPVNNSATSHTTININGLSLPNVKDGKSFLNDLSYEVDALVRAGGSL